MGNLTKWCVSALCLVVAPAMAAPQVSATIEDATVERATDGEIIVRWRAVPNDAPIDVVIDGRLISDDDRDGRHALSATDAARRPLVHLTTANGKDFVTAERVLPLTGGRNFRDLGGYRTSDGQRVRWGKVYRSGTMAQLTDDDYELLSQLGIRVICDFRTNQERKLEPTAWEAHGAKIDYRTHDYDHQTNRRSMFGEGPPTAEGARLAMIRLYGDLPYELADSYRTMFKSLAAGEIPLAFNCSAGKDRTGVGAALLLTLLGVPRETIVADYALSDRIVDYEAIYSNDKAAHQQGAASSLAKLPAEIRGPVLRSDPAYIRAALEAIESKEGSIDAYFERVLGLNESERVRIRESLLEPAG